MNNELMVGIIKCLKYNCNNSTSARMCVNYLVSISKTKNFVLVKKFFKKSDKEEIKNFLIDLEQYNDTKETAKELQSIF